MVLFLQSIKFNIDNFWLFSYFIDRAVLDTIRNLSLKNDPSKKSSTEYIDTITKKQLQYKKHKQVVPVNHHSGTNIARTLLSIFGKFFYFHLILDFNFS